MSPIRTADYQAMPALRYVPDIGAAHVFDYECHLRRLAYVRLEAVMPAFMADLSLRMADGPRAPKPIRDRAYRADLQRDYEPSGLSDTSNADLGA